MLIRLSLALILSSITGNLAILIIAWSHGVTPVTSAFPSNPGNKTQVISATLLTAFNPTFPTQQQWGGKVNISFFQPLSFQRQLGYWPLLFLWILSVEEHR